MKPRVRHIPTRFAEAVFQPGGLLVTSALRRAEAALEARADSSLVVIDQAIGAIDALAAAPGPDPGALADAVAGHALDIIDAAFAYPGTDVETCARLVAELAALGAQANRIDDAALALAAASLRLLFHQGRGMTESERLQVLDGVTRLIRKRLGEPGPGDRPQSD